MYIIIYISCHCTWLSMWLLSLVPNNCLVSTGLKLPDPLRPSRPWRDLKTKVKGQTQLSKTRKLWAVSFKSQYSCLCSKYIACIENWAFKTMNSVHYSRAFKGFWKTTGCTCLYRYMYNNNNTVIHSWSENESVHV